MRHMRIISLASLAALLVVGTAGCPQSQNPTFDVWVVNTSSSFRITSVKVKNSSDMTTRELVTQDGIATSETGAFTNNDATPFANAMVDITISGTNTSKGVVQNVQTTVSIPDAVHDGLVIPIVVSGENDVDYGAQYYPLDPSTKVTQYLKHVGQGASTAR